MLRVLLGCCVLATGAEAAEPEFPAQIWLSPGFYSYHFDRHADLREDNTGFGMEVTFAPEHAMMAGSFINSAGRRSRYGGYQWRALQWQRTGFTMHAGVALGMIDGYPRMRGGGAFVVALPLLAIEGRYLGANLTAFPSIGDKVEGAIAVQIKFRVR